MVPCSPTFPSTCLSPDQPGYGQVVSNPKIRRRGRRSTLPMPIASSSAQASTSAVPLEHMQPNPPQATQDVKPGIEGRLPQSPRQMPYGYPPHQLVPSHPSRSPRSPPRNINTHGLSRRIHFASPALSTLPNPHYSKSHRNSISPEGLSPPTSFRRPDSAVAPEAGPSSAGPSTSRYTPYDNAPSNRARSSS